MKSFLVLMLLATPAWALTDNFGRTVTVAGDAYSVPGVTIVAKSQAAALATLNAMSPTDVVVAVTNTVPVWDFFNRFTTAEFVALQGNAAAAAIIARLNAYGARGGGIVVTDPTITGYMAQAVGAGLITAPRSAQILNLAVSSP